MSAAEASDAAVDVIDIDAQPDAPRSLIIKPLIRAVRASKRPDGSSQKCIAGRSCQADRAAVFGWSRGPGVGSTAS